MKKSGFTMVEMLAVMVVLGLLLLLAIPAYIKVFNSIKRDNYLDKVELIETAMNKYGELIKDEIKDVYDKNGGCKEFEVADLIKNGYLESDGEVDDFLVSPIDDSKMTNKVYACYCPNKLDIKSYYAEEFDQEKSYNKGDIVKCSDDNSVKFYRVNTFFGGIKKLEEEKTNIENNIVKLKNGDEYLKVSNGIESTYKIVGGSDNNKYFSLLDC